MVAPCTSRRCNRSSAALRWAAATTFAVLVSTSSVLAQGLPSLAEPGVSPDGSEIAFVSGGDIWTVPSTGGAARLLVAHSANESRPLYSPDGGTLAFNSDRSGAKDVYLMNLRAGTVSRLTHDSGDEDLSGWSPDGAWIYLTSNAQDVAGMHDVYRVRASGGTPMAVAADRYATEFHAAPSPEEGLVAIAARARMAQSQWWRNGHSHIDESEIWTVRIGSREGEAPEYAPVSVGGKNLWPMWGSRADRVFFVSDRNGSENLWSARAGGGDEKQHTHFTEGRVLWPSMAADGSLIAFERDFAIWTYDVGGEKSLALDVRLMGAVEGPTSETEEVTSGWDDISVSPDGEKWAFTRGGDVFATTMEGDVPATRVTDTPAEEYGIQWSADSRQIVYSSWRTGVPKLHAFDFVTGEERPLTQGPGADEAVEFSPDGNFLLFGRFVDETRQLLLWDWETGSERHLASDVTGAAAWSPDSRWVAFAAETDEFANVMVAPAEAGPARQVSFMANSFLGPLEWSATGEYIVFGTGQRTEPRRVAKVDLVPLAPTFDEDAFRDLFDQPDEVERRGEDESVAEEEAAEPAPAVEPPTRVEIVFDGVRRRGAFVDTDFSVQGLVLSPDGETAVASGDGALHRITFGPNGDVDVVRLDARGTPLGFDRAGRQLYVSRGGQLRVVTLPGGAERTVETSVEITDDFERTKIAAFEQGWGEMSRGFYDHRFHGADWEGVRDRFRPQIEGARTRAEFSRLMNLMLGELNASHLGHRGRTGPPQGGDGVTTGRLGLRFDRHAYERDGRFVVREVLELGPAHVGGEISEGDEVLTVGGTTLDARADLYQILRDTPGEQVSLGVRSPGESQPTEVELRAASPDAERQLVYRNWVEDRRAFVDEISGGRLGYAHIASMSEAALDQLIFDLDQPNHAREGVVIDVRNNNGGFVNVYALDILSRRDYFTMEDRGSSVAAPSRVRLGQRALLSPTVLVTNQNTLSDGEDFTEGYRSLGLGSVVGEATAGWIIYTGSRGLVDGTTVRMPRVEIRDGRGELMELNPRPVDVVVERPVGESHHGRDTQLERAVAVLLSQIDEGR